MPSESCSARSSTPGASPRSSASRPQTRDRPDVHERFVRYAPARTCVRAAQPHRAGPASRSRFDRSMPCDVNFGGQVSTAARARQPADGRARSSASSTTLRSDRRRSRRAIRRVVLTRPRRDVVRAALTRKRTHRFQLRIGGRPPDSIEFAHRSDCRRNKILRRFKASLLCWSGQNIAASCSAQPTSASAPENQQLIARSKGRATDSPPYSTVGEPNRNSRSVIYAQESQSACANPSFCK